MKRTILTGAGMALGLIAQSANVWGAVIAFSGQSGSSGAPFLVDLQDGFTTTAVSGTWLQSQGYGNPIPSIFVGPQGSPAAAVLQVVADVPFRFLSLDYSSNNGTSSFTVQGFSGGVLRFTQSGSLAGSFAPFGFQTLQSTSVSTEVQSVVIGITPGDGVGSVNIDNVTVVSSQVPEPSCASLVALSGLVLLIAKLTGVLRGTVKLMVSGPLNDLRLAPSCRPRTQ
jgi:hypothetical protein